MKGSRQYYLLFGATVCVGVVAYFYLVHRRKNNPKNLRRVIIDESVASDSPVPKEKEAEEEVIKESVSKRLKHSSSVRPKQDICFEFTTTSGSVDKALHLNPMLLLQSHEVDFVEDSTSQSGCLFLADDAKGVLTSKTDDPSKSKSSALGTESLGASNSMKLEERFQSQATCVSVKSDEHFESDVSTCMSVKSEEKDENQTAYMFDEHLEYEAFRLTRLSEDKTFPTASAPSADHAVHLEPTSTMSDVHMGMDQMLSSKHDEILESTTLVHSMKLEATSSFEPTPNKKSGGVSLHFDQVKTPVHDGFVARPASTLTTEQSEDDDSRRSFNCESPKEADNSSPLVHWRSNGPLDNGASGMNDEAPKPQSPKTPPIENTSKKDANDAGVSPMQIAETLMRLSKPNSLTNLSFEDAHVLHYTMSFIHGKELARILEIIAQAASFNVNLPVLSASGCLQSAQVLLHNAAMDRRCCSQNVKISLLHALTNLSASDEHQQALKTSVDDLFSLSEGQEESRVGLACLCVIANLSLTKYCHLEISAFGSRLFELLEDEDTGLLKQILTILLNLCCEKSTVPLLLIAKAPAEMGTFVAKRGPIGNNTDLLIKWLRILRNLYKGIREDKLTADNLGLASRDALDPSVFQELQRLRLHMKACVFLLCHNKESHGLAAGAKMLYEYLEVND